MSDRATGIANEPGYTIVENASLEGRNTFRVPARAEMLVDIHQSEVLPTLAGYASVKNAQPSELEFFLFRKSITSGSLSGGYDLEFRHLMCCSGWVWGRHFCFTESMVTKTKKTSFICQQTSKQKPFTTVVYKNSS